MAVRRRHEPSDMTVPLPTHSEKKTLPALSRDGSFYGMTATQFLGAFNDNLFKQLILLLCVDYAASAEGDDYQSIALGLFAVPFVLFSGFAGWFSDRTSKRTIVVLCKVAEIGVMVAGMLVFLSGEIGSLGLLSMLFVVLFFMSSQSAFFGPAKYGILPEMLQERDLPPANGVIQMTTFLAIIFGTAAAGYLKENLEGRLWIINACCIGIAVVGTLTSLFVRKTPIAHPGLTFNRSSLGINRQTRQMLKQDRTLLGVLLISSLFWFVGGVVLPTVNVFGKLQMQIGDSRTGLLASCVGVGIAFGCVLSGKLSKNRVRFELVTVGAWGMVLMFAAIAWLGTGIVPPAAQTIKTAPASIADLLWPVSGTEFLARLLLTGMGIFAGIFAVPLQVFMQARPPEDQKGRMIGAMNLINWIGILASAGFYAICSQIFNSPSHPISWTFAVMSVVMLPVAILYRPRDGTL